MQHELSSETVTPAESHGAELDDFDALVESYRPRVLRFMLASLHDREAAENLTQDCFVRAYQARGRFRGDSRVVTWLMHIAANLVRDHESSGRLKFWRRSLRSDVDVTDVGEFVPDRQRSPEALVSAKEQVQAVWGAASRLPERQRTVFLLRFVEDMDLLEIASVTGIRRETMNQHLTPEQIAEQLIGGAPHDGLEHARQCPACGSEVSNLEGALLDFRGAMHNWTNHICPPETPALHLQFRRSPWTGNRARAGLGSIALHATALAAALTLSTLKPVRIAVDSHVIPLFAPPPVMKPAPRSGGGGGGARQPEAKKAELPKTAPRLFVPPRVDRVEARLELPSALLDVPDSGALAIGAIDGLNALNGAGYRGGIGTGPGGGDGPGNGPGAGPGCCGGTGGGLIYIPGGDVTKPIPISMPEPQYSEEARKAKWSGVVKLSFVVDETGHTMEIHVLKPLGLGLDEKAIDAVTKWLFKPGTKAGKPVKTRAEVDVSFRLL